MGGQARVTGQHGAAVRGGGVGCRARTQGGGCSTAQLGSAAGAAARGDSGGATHRLDALVEGVQALHPPQARVRDAREHGVRPVRADLHTTAATTTTSAQGVAPWLRGGACWSAPARLLRGVLRRLTSSLLQWGRAAHGRKTDLCVGWGQGARHAARRHASDRTRAVRARGREKREAREKKKKRARRHLVEVEVRRLEAVHLAHILLQVHHGRLHVAKYDHIEEVFHTYVCPEGNRREIGIYPGVQRGGKNRRSERPRGQGSRTRHTVLRIRSVSTHTVPRVSALHAPQNQEQRRDKRFSLLWCLPKIVNHCGIHSDISTSFST